MKKKIKRAKKIGEKFELDAWVIFSLVLFIFLIISFLIENAFGITAINSFIKTILWLLVFLGVYVYFFKLRRPFSKSFRFVKDSKNFIYAVILIFFVFALAGFFIPTPEALGERIMEFIKQLLEKTQDMSQFELTKFIFLNNLKSSFSGMIFGIFFGIFPVVMAISNGFLLGFVSLISVGYEGILVLWRLFPHGIFELPAIFISLGLGLKLGSFVFQTKKTNPFKVYFWNSLRVFFFVVIPLLFVGAIVEAGLIALFG